MNTKTVSSFKNNFFQPCSKTLQYLQKIGKVKSGVTSLPDLWLLLLIFKLKLTFAIVFTGCLKQKFHNAVLVGQSLYSHFYS